MVGTLNRIWRKTENPNEIKIIQSLAKTNFDFDIMWIQRFSPYSIEGTNQSMFNTILKLTVLDRSLFKIPFPENPVTSLNASFKKIYLFHQSHVTCPRVTFPFPLSLLSILSYLLRSGAVSGT